MSRKSELTVVDARKERVPRQAVQLVENTGAREVCPEVVEGKLLPSLGNSEKLWSRLNS